MIFEKSSSSSSNCNLFICFVFSSFIVISDKSTKILFDKFNVKRLGIVGGSKINTAFLKANLLDEIVLLIGAGIDARIGYTTLFDGLDENSDVIPLQLNKVKSFESGAVMISYKTIK